MNIQEIKITNIENTQPIKLNNAQTITMLMQIDETPTENSTNAVSSGGVYTSLKELDNKIDNIDLSEYAKKEYVDEALKNVDVDLTNYYTKDEVDNALKNVEVDLSNYYTKDELQETLDEKVELSFDDKLGDIDTILTEIVGSTLEVDNKEY